MKKRIIATILIFAISLNIEAYYNSTKYIKVVDVQGNVKLEVDVKGSTEIQASKKMIQKPARLGDLLFTRAVQQNDIPVLMGNLAITTALYQLGLVILDISYGFLDPRIKVGGKL